MPQTKKKKTVQELYDSIQPYQEDNTTRTTQPPTSYQEDLVNKIRPYVPDYAIPTQQTVENVKTVLNAGNEYVVQPVASGLGWVADKLSRGQYASAKFFDANKENTWNSFVGAVSAAAKEFVDPKEKLSFKNVIEKNNPEFAKNNPTTTDVLGFLGDVFLDPLTYAGIGLAKKGIPVGGNVLSKEGEKALASSLKYAGSETRFIPKQKPKINPITAIERLEKAQKTGKLTPNDLIIAKDLRDIGYYDKLKDKIQSINNFANDNKIVLKQNEIVELAKDETLKDLKVQFKQGLDLNYPANINFTPNEIYETAETRISKVFGANPQLTSKEGLRLTAGLPFATQYDIPGSQAMLKLLGVDHIRKGIQSLGRVLGEAPGGNFVGRTFVKEFDPGKRVPNDFWDALHSLENTFDTASQQMEFTAKQLAETIPLERRTKIQEMMYELDDLTRKREETLGRTVTPTEAAQLKQTAILNANLKPEEMAYVASLYDGYNRMMVTEMRAKLLRSTLENYTHREWDMLNNAKQFTDVTRHGSGLSPILDSSKARKYETYAEGVANGKVPELDAAVVYAQRALMHREKMAIANFNETTREIFGLKGKNKTVLTPSGYRKVKLTNQQLTREELNQLPKVVQSNIKMLGDAVYPSSMDDNWKSFLQFIDSANSWWKKGAYVIKPSSGIKQGISNPIQAAIIQGAKAFKAFDPTAAVGAGILTLGKSVKAPSSLPPFFKNVVNKWFQGSDAVMAEHMAFDRLISSHQMNDFTSGYKKVSVLGQQYDGKYLADSMVSNGVIKGFDQSGELISRKINRALLNNTDANATVAKELAKYWKWPSLVEDYGRAMVYLNGLGMGYSEKKALEMVNKTLFNYSRGLSWTEQNVFRRLVPFYTYQRFAIPLVFKSILTKPGNIATGEKFVKLMGNLMTKDRISPAEQELLSPFLLEQPHVFTGFDKDNKAYYNIFNNMSPLDALNLLEHDKNGDIDWRRSMEKTVLAQITPFIKVPLELIEKKNFFTNQTLDKAGKLGVTNETLSIVIPQQYKDMMGWEDRIDVNGKRQTYINPYLAHISMSAFPGLKTVLIDPAFSDDTPLTKAMELITGIKSHKVDFLEQQQYKVAGMKKELKEIKAKFFSSQIKGSMSEYSKAYEDYQTFIQNVDKSKALASNAKVRGAGMTQEELNKLEQQ